MKALLLIECQNEWLHPAGKLHSLMRDEVQFQTSHNNIKTALAHARRAGLPVLHTHLLFEPGHPELLGGKAGLRKAIPQAGTFVKNSFGAAVHPDFVPQAGELITKGRTGASAFTGSDLEKLLAEKGIDTLYVAGYALHVCVESTIREAHDKGFHTTLIKDASAAFTRTQQLHVLNEVIHHIADTITTDLFINTN